MKGNVINQVYWNVVRFKQNEILRLEQNLKRQKFIFYIPKISYKSSSKQVKLKALFPGYCFIKNINNSINLNSLKYTRGVVSIVKFGSNYPSIHGDMITEIQNIEKKSRDNPIENKLEVGDQVVIKKGLFKDHISEIVSLSSDERVTIFLNFLGSKTNLTMNKKTLKKLWKSTYREIVKYKCYNVHAVNTGAVAINWYMKKIESLSELDLDILGSIDSRNISDQRTLSQTIGSSLGKVNYCLRELIKVGFVKIENFSNSDNKMGYSYILTPKGIEAKVLLTKHFLRKKMEEYERIQEYLWMKI